MIDIKNFLRKCSSIYDFYQIGVDGLSHPEVLEKTVKKKTELLQFFTGFPDAETFFKEGKIPLRDFFISSDIADDLMKGTQETIMLGKNFLKNQTVVLYHSYIEIIMLNIMEMILRKDSVKLKNIYMRKKPLPIQAKELIDNRDDILSLMINKELNLFSRLNMRQKSDYFKKNFDIDFESTKDKNFNTDIYKIDILRHDIIHSNKEVVVDEEMLTEIHLCILELGINLLIHARRKYKIDVVWIDSSGIDIIK